MKIGRNIIFPFILVLSILASLGSLFFNANNYIFSLLTFIYLITVPGLLIYYSLGIKHLDFWSRLIVSIGLSISFLMIPGIIFNFLWTLYSNEPPLETGLLVRMYGILILILIVFAYLRNKGASWKINIDFISSIKKIYFVIPPIITVLSIFAANLLNNGDSNILAIVSLSLIAITLITTILLYKKINAHFLPWSLYFHSLSLLLILSMRSLYISGWDIQSEFAVFQLTKNLSRWSPTIWNGAYNACLSITLLPTVISRLTSFNDDYIYKLLYQILFAFTPIIIYQLFKRYTLSIIAFIAIIYIISQPLFIQPMTALMRQEIAFIFFMLMSYILFDSHLNRNIRIGLITTFGISMVLSHYSTTYVTLLLLTSTYLFTSIFRLTEKIPLLRTIYIKSAISSSIKFYSYYINPLILIILFCFTIFWFGYVNNQLGQIQRVTTEGLARMNELFRSDLSSNESKKAVTFLKNDHTTSEDIREYTNNVLLKEKRDRNRLYAPELYANFEIFPLIPPSVKPLFISPYNKYVIITFEILKQIFKACVIISPLYLFFFHFRKFIVPREYIILSLISVVLIFVVTFHPYVSLQYNLSRLYLQLLFFLALPTILLTTYVFNPIKKIAVYINGILIVFIFIYLVGIPNQILGGEAKMYFNNYGADYDKFYIHKEELASAEWLKENIGTKLLLFADREAYLRIFRIVERGYNFNVHPALIYRDAYVYGSYANVVNNRTAIFNEGMDIVFNFPRKFLEDNKNVIYNNGNSKIYR